MNYPSRNQHLETTPTLALCNQTTVSSSHAHRVRPRQYSRPATRVAMRRPQATGCAKIVTDIASGAPSQREGLEAALEFAR
ncbi:MAG: hypothetical protein HC933_05720 [Pleurocapsa sp. SU_196_0]|nr:hypothetical protein [Pleurocapsa sp. SU_196_0]